MVCFLLSLVCGIRGAIESRRACACADRTPPLSSSQWKVGENRASKHLLRRRKSPKVRNVGKFKRQTFWARYVTPTITQSAQERSMKIRTLHD